MNGGNSAESDSRLEGGKDSAIAFMELSHDPRYKIGSLLTTITEGYERVSMHEARVSLMGLIAFGKCCARIVSGIATCYRDEGCTT